MAFDGVTIAALVAELKSRLVGGRVMKISQPEKDELILTVKNYEQYRLLLSADASLPLVYLTDTVKEAPLNSPAFCMLLRKHLQSARVTDISQPGLERIINIDFEHLDDMGDLKNKRLIIEIMGKHSNIIFCDDEGTILDSIKRIPASVSSVREVLPGRSYFIARTSDKLELDRLDAGSFAEAVFTSNEPLAASIYKNITGISPTLANEIVYRSGLEPDAQASAIGADLREHMTRVFMRFIEDIRDGHFSPCLMRIHGEPYEYAAVELGYVGCMEGAEGERFESISELLECYYETRNTLTRIRQRSSDLSRIIANSVSRASKKYELQLKQLKDTEKRDRYRVWGELLTTYGYGVEEGAKEAVVDNYYTGMPERIPLDEQLSAIDNAKSYFDRYAKLKRTYEALSGYIEETKAELEHLESVRLALDIARHEEDLSAIREELTEFGYMKRRQNGPGSKGTSGKGNLKSSRKGGRRVSTPFHYVTPEGFHIYVGKNNYQNDELTFKFATGRDWWFHIKQAAGSHVILRTDDRPIPDAVFEQAASLAAYYSSRRNDEKAEVDYLEKKNVKKPNGAKPGFVVYYTNYSMIVHPYCDGVEQVE